MSCFRIASDYDTCVTEKVSFFASFIVILGDCLLFSSPNSEKDNQNHSQIFYYFLIMRARSYTCACALRVVGVARIDL